MVASMASHASMDSMSDDGLSNVRGQFNVVSGLNIGLLSDSILSVGNLAGGHSGGTVANALGG